jgi:hypothetical protein
VATALEADTDDADRDRRAQRKAACRACGVSASS